jgi:hypothetical protein
MSYNVYLVCAEIGGERLYKIGYTRRSIEKRIKELKTGNAAEFYIVNSFESKWGTKIEAILHRSFSGKKVNGEWFLLDDYDIKSFGKRCNEIHSNLELVSKSLYYIEKGDF